MKTAATVNIFSWQQPSTPDQFFYSRTIKFLNSKHGRGPKACFCLIRALVIQFIVLFSLISPLQVAGAKDKKSDSLLRIINTRPDIEKVTALNQLASHLLDIDTPEAFNYIQRSLKLCNHLNDQSGKTEVYSLLGQYYRSTNKLPLAFSAHKKSCQIAKSRSDYKNQILNLIQMAEIGYIELKTDTAEIMLNQAEKLITINNYNQALPAIYNCKANIANRRGLNINAIYYYTKAAQIYVKIKNEKNLAVVYENIGTLNTGMGNYPQANYCLKEAERLLIKNKQIEKLADIYNDFGVMYGVSDSVEKSIFYYSKAIGIDREYSRTYSLAKDYLNLANVFSNRKEFKTATAYYDSSLVLCRQYNITYGILLNNINRGQMYSFMGDNTRALSTLLPLIAQLDEYNLPGEKIELFNMLYLSYKQSGNYEKALSFLEKYKQGKDSIAGEQKNKSILELQARYEKEKEQNKIAELQQSALNNRNAARLSIIGMLVILIIMTAAGFLLFIQKRAAIHKQKLTYNENDQLNLRIELKDKELIGKSMQLASVSEATGTIATMINKVLPSADEHTQKHLSTILKELEFKSPEISWKEFETRFEQVHEAFYRTLFQRHPGLTPAEVRLCSFLKLNMANKDIALLTNRSIRTIENTRISIRKKIQLSTKDNLTSYLLSV
ncbi:MAG: tetratricopeptide repeat protein [Bacteroidota bacterium]